MITKFDRPERDWSFQAPFLLKIIGPKSETMTNLFQVGPERSGKQSSNLWWVFPCLQWTTGPACLYHMGLFLSQLKDKQSQKTYGIYSTIL